MPGYLNYSMDANGEGPDTIWVFVAAQPVRIVILKVHFLPANNTVALYAELSGTNVVGIRMGHDWLLPIREFVSPNDRMDLLHIPSRTTMHLPMHEEVRNLSDLNSMNYHITIPFHDVLPTDSNTCGCLFTPRHSRSSSTKMLRPPSLPLWYLSTSLRTGDIRKQGSPRAHILPGSRLCDSFSHKLDIENRSSPFRYEARIH